MYICCVAEEADENQYDDQPTPPPPHTQSNQSSHRTNNYENNRSAPRYDNRRQHSNNTHRSQHDNSQSNHSINNRNTHSSYDNRYTRQYTNNDRNNDARTNDRQSRRDDTHESREPVPPPTHPPWKAYFSNLVFDVNDDDLIQFCSPGVILDIKYPKDRDGNMKGSAFVEFETQEDLVNVIVQYNGQTMRGREVRIDYAKPRDDNAQRNTYRNEPTRRVRHDSSTSQSADHHTNQRSRRTSVNDKSIPERDLTEEEKAARPKLQLQKRTTTDKPAAPAQLTKTDIFGGARPREEVLAERPISDTAHANQLSENKTENSDNKNIQPSVTGNTIKILTEPTLATSTDSKQSIKKYQAKQPTLQTYANDRQLQNVKRSNDKSNNNANSQTNGKQSRDYKPNTKYQSGQRKPADDGVLKASNAYAGLAVDEDD